MSDRRPARQQIIEAAEKAGYTTDPGYKGADGPKISGWAGHKINGWLHVEFSIRGGITYAATRAGRFTGNNQLGQVLAFLEEEALR